MPSAGPDVPAPSSRGRLARPTRQSSTTARGASSPGSCCTSACSTGRVEEIAPEVDLPFGVHLRAAYRVQRLDLQPGDRLVMLTDGMLERRAVEADLPSLIVRTGALHPREASRALVAEVLRAHGGRLQDDATVLRTSSQPRSDGDGRNRAVARCRPLDAAHRCDGHTHLRPRPTDRTIRRRGGIRR
ncbi:SpoIIE family protein phosphatase [Streptomyces sp. WM6372]|uniref:SpoIIE family protein phosphatase n=1 Tax=Streptomyces sp. WM6372 TaxID=1415555 RepID=UPI002D219CEF|nr:SpoIIE family protein phosphatase [Streptomyces sp. WM6372]